MPKVTQLVVVGQKFQLELFVHKDFFLVTVQSWGKVINIFVKPISNLENYWPLVGLSSDHILVLIASNINL